MEVSADPTRETEIQGVFRGGEMGSAPETPGLVPRNRRGSQRDQNNIVQQNEK